MRYGQTNIEDHVLAILIDASHEYMIGPRTVLLDVFENPHVAEVHFSISVGAELGLLPTIGFNCGVHLRIMVSEIVQVKGDSEHTEVAIIATICGGTSSWSFAMGSSGSDETKRLWQLFAIEFRPVKNSDLRALRMAGWR